MTRDQVARVLRAGGPLEHRLGEVAGLGRERHDRTEDEGPDRVLAEAREHQAPTTTVDGDDPADQPGVRSSRARCGSRNFRRPNRLPTK